MRKPQSAGIEGSNEIVLRFIFFVIIILLANWYLFAEESSRRKPEIQQKVRVAYQVTDVTVRNGDGNFIKGLGADDFILEVDGKATPIKFVEEFSAPGAEELRDYLHKVAEAKKTGAEPPLAPSPPRLIVFAFDQFNMGPRTTLEAKALAKRIVHEVLLPYDRVIILRYNKFFVTLLGPSADRDQIIAAIDGADEPSANMRYLPTEFDLYDRVSTPGARSLLQKLEKQFSIELDYYFHSLFALTTVLDNIPDRKTCFLFSEGVNTYLPPRAVWRRGASYYGRRRPKDGSRFSAWASIIDTHSSTRKDIYSVRKHFEQCVQHLVRGFSSTNMTVYSVRRGPEKPEWYQAVLLNAKSKKQYQKYLLQTIEPRLNRIRDERHKFLQTLADSTNGLFLNFPFDEEQMLETIRKEIGNYYILGFGALEDSPGKFHEISVRINGSRYKVKHRLGFFEKKKFSQLSPEEREYHMEEGFVAPGIINEFGLVAEGYEIPLQGARHAFLSFEIELENLTARQGSLAELEMLICLKDKDGGIRFREHRIFKTHPDQVQKNTLWNALRVPLLREWCALYIALRDNSTGRRATWNKVFEKAEARDSVPMAGDPIMLTAVREGSLSEWQMEEVEEGTDTTGTTMLSGLEISVKPRLSGRVKQGEDTLILLTVGNLPSGFDPKQASLSVNFALDPNSDEAYLLSASDLKVQFLSGSDLMLITARVPLGLAQQESGELFVAVSGISGEQAVITGVPYRVLHFSQETARRLLSERAREITSLNQ